MPEAHDHDSRDGRDSHHSHAGHHHGIAADADQRYLAAALGLLVAFMVGEIVVAIVTDSLALISDAGHMLSDAGAIAVALWALRLAARPAAGSWTFGWKRAEILSALANGITLLIIAVAITVEAVRRLADSHPRIDGGPVLATALAGIVINLVVVRLLARANRASLNIRGAYQHILTDLVGFIGTAVAAVVILTTGWVQADAIASLVVVALMLHAGWGLLTASGRILLEAAPDHLDLEAIRTHLLEVEHIHDVHELHAWTVTSDLPSLSAHLVIDDTCFSDGHAPRILDQVQGCLEGHFDVDHSTFQLEPSSHADHERPTHT